MSNLPTSSLHDGEARDAGEARHVNGLRTVNRGVGIARIVRTGRPSASRSTRKQASGAQSSAEGRAFREARLECNQTDWSQLDALCSGAPASHFRYARFGVEDSAVIAYLFVGTSHVPL